jgi:glutathione S-transferase
MFPAINPAGFIPAIRDGDVTMVESIAIMECLMARYGPTPRAPDTHDPAFPAYQQLRCYIRRTIFASDSLWIHPARSLSSSCVVFLA